MSPGSSGGSTKHSHRAEHVAAPVRVPVARNKGARGSLEQKHRHAVDEGQRPTFSYRRARAGSKMADSIAEAPQRGSNAPKRSLSRVDLGAQQVQA